MIRYGNTNNSCFSHKKHPKKYFNDFRKGFHTSARQWIGRFALLIAMISFVFMGTIDSVLYVRLTHKMEEYAWFLSQIVLTVGFLVVSWPITWFRMFRGNITSEMRSIPLRWYAILGFLDAIDAMLGTIASPYLPGPLLSIFGKSIIPFTMAGSFIVLHTRYTIFHGLGVIIIICGVLVNTVPLIVKKNEDIQTNAWIWGLFIIGATIPAAVSNVYKEKILKDVQADVWHLNAWIATFQLGWGLLLSWTVFIPMPKPADHISPREFPEYITAASECFMGIGGGEHCKFTWMVFTVFIVFNVGVNVLMLYIYRKGSAVVAIVTGTVSMVIVNLLYHVPFIAGEALVTRFSPYNIIAVVVIIGGLVVYRYTKEIRTSEKEDEEYFSGDKKMNDDDDDEEEGFEMHVLVALEEDGLT